MGRRLSSRASRTLVQLLLPTQRRAISSEQYYRDGGASHVFVASTEEKFEVVPLGKSVSVGVGEFGNGLKP